jgi:outer membrane receptor for ferrienterochelin and colicin
MTIGGEASTTQRLKNSSFSLTGSYTNLALYDKLFKSSIDWEKPVESVNGTAVYRFKTKNNGLFKGYVTTDYGNLSYFAPTSNPAVPMLISNNGLTTYSNLSYRDCFSEKACYKIGVSSTAQNNKLGFGDNSLDTRELNIEGRFTATHDVSEGVIFSWGVSETYNYYDEDYAESTGFQHNSAFTDYLTGVFTESEIKFTKNFAVRPGLRTEYTTVVNRWNMSPRFAVALKTGKDAQLSAAWGLYYQTPQPGYLKISTDLDFEKATHYILSYQYGDASSRLFRAEAYYKTYNDLVTWQAGPYNQPTNLKNNGSGYAGGIDIFWRDLKSIKGLDYWITYSFVDTKRRYSYFPVEATPDFISAHTFSAVVKYWLYAINTQFGASFTAASGRPYNNPDSFEFMKEKTKAYSDLSLNFSHVFYIGNQYSVLYCSVNNVLGNDNVLSYRPSGISEAQGDYTLVPVKRDIKRFAFLGLFLNF